MLRVNQMNEWMTHMFNLILHVVDWLIFFKEQKNRFVNDQNKPDNYWHKMTIWTVDRYLFCCKQKTVTRKKFQWWNDIELNLWNWEFIIIIASMIIIIIIWIRKNNRIIMEMKSEYRVKELGWKVNVDYDYDDYYYSHQFFPPIWFTQLFFSH